MVHEKETRRQGRLPGEQFQDSIIGKTDSESREVSSFFLFDLSQL